MDTLGDALDRQNGIREAVLIVSQSDSLGACASFPVFPEWAVVANNLTHLIEIRPKIVSDQGGKVGFSILGHDSDRQ